MRCRTWHTNTGRVYVLCEGLIGLHQLASMARGECKGASDKWECEGTTCRTRMIGQAKGCHEYSYKCHSRSNGQPLNSHEAGPLHLSISHHTTQSC